MPKFIIAEYCEGPFYLGWWMYARDRNDGSQNDEGYDRWGWFRGDPEWNGVKAIWELCCELGHAPPVLKRNCDKFAEWFATTFPGGWLTGQIDGKLAIVEIVPKAPRQVRRGIIRTRLRADRSFERACREYQEAKAT